jgi:adenosylcobinamide kinase/adenosylcobinamide-phosphate guanylyltransferase
MGKLTFVIGGARSGKSSFAQKMAEESGKSVTFIATAQALDEEMSARIRKHQEERRTDWTTLEIPAAIAACLRENPTSAELYLLDCITLLVTNLIMQCTYEDIADEKQSTLAIENEISELLVYIREHEQDWIIISNEVGQGLVPPYQMGRVYRDLLGMANQRIASAADEVYWLVAGIPVPIQQFRGMSLSRKDTGTV